MALPGQAGMGTLRHGTGRRAAMLSWRTGLAGLVAVALLAAPAAPRAAAAASAGSGWHGYDAHVEAQQDPGQYVSLISGGGANSFRDDFSWASVEPEQGSFDWSSTDAIMTQAARHGLHVLMIADTSPAWASGGSTSQPDWYWLPPRDPATYGAFAGRLAARSGSSTRSCRPCCPRASSCGTRRTPPASGAARRQARRSTPAWSRPPGPRSTGLIPA